MEPWVETPSFMRAEIRAEQMRNHSDEKVKQKKRA